MLTRSSDFPADPVFADLFAHVAPEAMLAVLGQMKDDLAGSDLQSAMDRYAAHQEQIDVPKTDEGITKADIRVWAETDEALADLRGSLVSLSESMTDIADTTILIQDAESFEEPKDA